MKKNIILPKIEDIREEVIETILEKFDITKAAFFIRENLSQSVDYLKIKNELFNKMSVTDIFKDLKELKK